MFSKALFKQSCKANGTMWSIITFAVCFMLACVMLISGSGSIGETKNAIQETIVKKEIEASIENRAIGYYVNADDGMKKFDQLYSEDVKGSLVYLSWLQSKPVKGAGESEGEYQTKLTYWQSQEPEMTKANEVQFKNIINEWSAAQPVRSDYGSDEEYNLALAQWSSESPATVENAAQLACSQAASELKTYIYDYAASIDSSYVEGTNEADEIYGSVMYVLNLGGMFDEFYVECDGEAPEEYDIANLTSKVAVSLSGGTENAYPVSEEREEYRKTRSEKLSSIFIAGNMTSQETVEKLVETLSSYDITLEKYYSFGYDYVGIKHMSSTSIITYKGRLEYETELLQKEFADEEGFISDESSYNQALAAKKEELKGDISASLLSLLPENVSEALQEVGQLDLFSLVVGSIFYKLAGLLLPIIYVIMASNNLIVGQVDSGSMAYVLSTSTKRKTVAFTQGVYLLGSLLAMFLCTTLTGCVCLACITEEVKLTYGKLILLNLGAFCVLVALSGLCFFTSCLFDRSKRSMAIGGGLSIFALVAAMLGLFGSPVIPSVVRLDALNYFNYATVISLFDVISIIDGTSAFIWKIVVLAVIGIVGYVVGSLKFVKKDLPL